MTYWNYYYPTGTVSTARATPTLVQTIIHTSMNSTASIPQGHLPFPFTLEQTIRSNVLLLLSIPMLWFLAKMWTDELARRKARQPTTDEWLQAWQTLYFSVLHGLLRLQYDNKWDRSKSPFIGSQSVQRIWHRPNRPWLGRLLEMGVISLTIQDGGISTYKVDLKGSNMKKSWPWTWIEWPEWPMYVQSKKRAYFEFLLPRPYDTEARRNILVAIDNYRTNIEGTNMAIETSSVGVTICIGTPDENDIRYVSQQNPPAPGDLPMEVGVKSPLAALLPFLRDEVLVKGHGTRANNLSMFCRDDDPDKIPLLGYSELAVVRLEAKYYGQRELDAFVYGLAQEAGMKIEFPERNCRDAALKELRDCGLPTMGLK